MNVIRSTSLRILFYLLCLQCFAISAFADSKSNSVDVWHVPHLYSTVEEASSRIQLLTPVLTSMDKYPAERITVTRYGLNLLCSRSSVRKNVEYFWGWDGGHAAPVYTAVKDERIVSVDYSKVISLSITLDEKAKYTAKWQVFVSQFSASGPASFGVDSEANARVLVDALATLIVASGNALPAHMGPMNDLELESISSKEQQKNPQITGMRVVAVSLGGPLSQAGILAGDILTEVNGEPAAQGQPVSWYRLSEKGLRENPSGFTMHAKFYRAGAYIEKDLVYASPLREAAALRANAAQAGQKPVAAKDSSVATEAPAAVRLGIQARSVTPEDAQKLNLPQNGGVIVLGIDKGSLAEMMQLQNGDAILGLDGQKVTDLDQFKLFLHKKAISSLSIWRNGAVLQVTVPQSL
jgi:hypothetical protein